MELVCALLLLMLGTSAAAPQDLSGKGFTFPQETDTDYVTLKLNRTELRALTVCMRVFSDLRRPHGLFLLTTDSSSDTKNNLLMMNDPRNAHYQFQYNNSGLFFNYKDNYILNAWQTMCSTWDSASGLVQIFIDGKYSSRKFLSDSHMMGPMSLILGQGGVGRRSFDKSTSFVGMVTELHVWDYVLPSSDIRSYSSFTRFPHGNVLDWHSLEFEIHGRVLVE